MVSTYQLQEDYESSTEWYTLEVRQSEVPLYGSSRLGLHLTDRLIRRYYNDDDENGYDEWDATVPGLATGTITAHSREVGHKAYELPNHLGNVLATVSDRKWPVFSEPKPGKWQFEHFQAELLSASEYYPFGMEMPGRIASSESYRYGFNGKEKDDEIKGSGVQYDYGFRVYDARMGKFLSVDPLSPDYPMLTPFQFASNTPIWAIDLDGLEASYTSDGKVVYEVMAGQGPTQISKDLKSQGIDVSWEQIVASNPTYFSHITEQKWDKTNKKYTQLNMNVGDVLSIGEYFVETGWQENKISTIVGGGSVGGTFGAGVSGSILAIKVPTDAQVWEAGRTLHLFSVGVLVGSPGVELNGTVGNFSTSEIYNSSLIETFNSSKSLAASIGGNFFIGANVSVTKGYKPIGFRKPIWEESGVYYISTGSLQLGAPPDVSGSVSPSEFSWGKVNVVPPMNKKDSIDRAEKLNNSDGEKYLQENGSHR